MQLFIEKVFSGLFFVLNPLLIVPIYLGMTAACNKMQRRAIAFKSCVFALGLCWMATIFGKNMLDAIGISSDSLRIAGGLLLLYVGFHMIVDEIKDHNHSESEVSLDIAIVPLGFPIITGPGTLTLVMSYIADAPDPSNWTYRLIVMGIAAGIIALVYISCLFATSILKLLGKNGMVVVQRIIGLIIVAFSVQMITAGITGSFHLSQSKVVGHFYNNENPH
jgi:multiple antibiotic resistance protein